MGAPIYLVSACTSGEEFIAAFRRYADKNGLFIPIGEPLPPGRRSRFAVTLRDGGVMVEGEAEIVSSARAPSVLHGRVGMTLRFLAPDDASRITLGELEKARLAMRPPPPSVPPRPAEVPADPRPVPPPIQGRIDAVNALAECVAIGDVAALGPPLPPVTIPPPKTGPRFVVPAIPPGRSGPGTSPPGGLGVASRTTTAPRSSTAPLPIAIARPEGGAARDDRGDAQPPAITPRATPQPDRLRSAERAPERVSGLSQTMTAVEIAPGPTSDTMVAATPPAPATLPDEPRLVPGATDRFENGPLSATMTAVPLPSPNPPSAPTEIGGPLVVPIDADDDVSARTQIHAGAPLPPPSHDPAAVLIDTAPLHAGVRSAVPPVEAAATLSDAPLRAPEPRPSPPSPITVNGMPPGLRPPASSSHHEIEIAEPTDISMPPEPPSSPSLRLPAEAAPSTEPEAIALERMPSTELEAAALESDTESSTESSVDGLIEPLIEPSTEPPVELSLESPDRSSLEASSEPFDEPADDAGDEPAGDPSAEIQAPVVQESGAITHQLSAEPAPDAAPGRPRRTVIGVAVQPSGVLVPPAPSTRRPAQVAEPDEPTGIIVGDRTIDAGAATVPPESGQLFAADEPPPSEPAPAPRMATGNALPSGDWTIALDPAAPDGWSSPFHALPRHPLDGGSPAPPSARPHGPPGSAAPADGLPAPVPHLKTPPMSPVAIAASASMAAPVPDPAFEPTFDPTLDPTPGPVLDPASDPASGPVPGAPLRPSEMPIVEPKVQIDPTLIEPAYAVPPDGSPAAASSPGLAHRAPDLAIYGSEPGREAVEAPALHMMMAVPQPGPYASPHPPPAPQGGHAPGYALDPSYQMMPPVAMQPGLTADGSGFGALRYPPQPSQVRRRHLVIMLASAVVAVLLGIAAMLVFRRPAAAPPSPGQQTESRGAAETPAPGESPRVPAGPVDTAAPATPPPATTAPPPGAAPPPATTTPPAAAAPPPAGSGAAPAHAAAAAPTPPASSCYADVTSSPAGADIVIGQTNVIGTTPQRVALPCGEPVELLVRKSRLVPATHTITPSPEGTSVQFVLVRQTFLVKVSSTPAGATVTLSGKSLGVTPTMVKVPAFESSTLVITKDGYETEAEKVAPRANGAAVHTTLKKVDRKKPR